MAKILIVDDSVFARNRLKRLFESGGHEIVGSVGDGEQALTQFKQLQPELVTLDYLMDNKTGEVVLKEIIKIDPSARVIMISGSSDKTLEKRALDAGAKVFIEKFNERINILKVIDQVMEI